MWLIKKNNDEGLSLKDLINLEEWQKIQDNFSGLMDIGIRLVDPEGRFLTSPSRESRLCTQLLEDTGKKEMLCGNCLPAFLGGKGIVDKNLNFICNAGLYNFIVPIKLHETKVLGYIMLGPVVLVMRKAKEEYRKIAEELNLELEDFWSALLEIKVASLHGMLSLVELVDDMCEYTVNLAYGKLVKERTVIMGGDTSKLGRILNVLLDVAFEVSQADIGSVMSFDESNKILTIRASKGIPDEIARKVKVKLGEGISGIVAKDGEPFLIDDNFRDNRIKPYLSRSYLSSSMILPIKAEDKVVGVISLGAMKTSPVRFDKSSMQVMNRLVDLVGVAISPSK